MCIKEQLKEGCKAWVPKKYRALTTKKYPDIVRLVTTWFFFSLIIMSIVGIPSLLTFQENIEMQLHRFSTFSLSSNISLEAPIEVSQTPLIIINPSQENLSDENILLTSENIQIKRAFWQEPRIIPWSTILSVSEHASMYAQWISILLIVLLPTILLLVCLFFFIQALLLVLIVASISFIILKISRFHLSFSQLLKISTLMLIPLFTLQIIPLFYFRWLLIPLILYVLMTSIAIFLTGESKLERSHKKRV